MNMIHVTYTSASEPPRIGKIFAVARLCVIDASLMRFDWQRAKCRGGRIESIAGRLFSVCSVLQMRQT